MDIIVQYIKTLFNFLEMDSCASMSPQPFMGVGTRLDENPALFFTLHNVNIDALISKAIVQKYKTLLNKSGRKRKQVIESNDIFLIIEAFAIFLQDT